MLISLLFATAVAADSACDASITLPQGFCATVFADSLQGPRHIVVAPNGVVYVTVTSGALALRDTKATGRADRIEHFGEVGGTGIAWHDGSLYLDTRTAILRYTPQEEAAPTGKADTIVRDLPTGGHGARNIAFDRAGRMYVNIGSRTNSCQSA